MTPGEVQSYLTQARVCRVASVDADGNPHVSPLWFVWDGTHLWLNSLVRSRRWTDVVRDPRIAVVIDCGDAFAELHGVEMIGTTERVGDIPRGNEPCESLSVPELLFARKYSTSETFKSDGRHGWLRVTPSRIVSWDFRKAATG
ncbi:pyridoxamine 5'-phosphate oxidase family protein [Gordonia sp. DT218]|uniref:pyridoxamine 5'-phosphate oxidase family protein n=1 Tax=Gordonia sp. DT218 TaxID=3416659 RepID=UPI003CEDD808